jgi:hypothetical protein
MQLQRDGRSHAVGEQAIHSDRRRCSRLLLLLLLLLCRHRCLQVAGVGGPRLLQLRVAGQA